jgi:hypothetical protein
LPAASATLDAPFARTPDRSALQPWALALLVAAPLVAAYLILAPPAGDLAAATYRSDLFARVGFSARDTGWYAAHGYWLPSYSLLSPALGALLGVRLLLGLSALAACALFGSIAGRVFPDVAARVASAVFALGFWGGLLSGRVPFDLGFAIGLGAVLALLLADRGSRRVPRMGYRSSIGALAPALGLAVLTSAASPVAGAFLALAALAGALAARVQGPSAGDSVPGRARRDGGRAVERVATNGARARDCLLLAAASLAPILTLSIAYPNGGYEPFTFSALWPVLGGVLLIALLLPQGALSAHGRLAIRAGAALYALGLIAAYATRTPMGGNAARLGPLLAAPLIAGALLERRRLALLALAAPLLYWQLVTPIHDYASLASDPSVDAAYYAPVRAELRRLDGGHPTIVEVPLTKAHWESVYLAGHEGVELARGWERQLDTRYGAIFYKDTLSPAAYRAWLRENHVRYVALPDAPLDSAGRGEGALIARGAPYLRQLWHSQHWRLYRIMG